MSTTADSACYSGPRRLIMPLSSFRVLPMGPWAHGPTLESNPPGITSWRLIHGDERGRGREIAPSSHG